MAYIKQVWNEVDTYITAERLNYLETQYDEGYTDLQNHEASVGGVHGLLPDEEVASKDYVDTKVAEAGGGGTVDVEAIRTDTAVALGIEVRTSDPTSPFVGQMWLRSDL